MSSVTSFIPFIKSQAEIYLSAATKAPTDERFSNAANSFANLLKLLEEVAEKERVAQQESAQSLSWSELKGLPDELLAELKISGSDRLEFDILDVIAKQGGIANLDRILLELYKLRAEVFKRQDINSRLYRMTKRGMLHSVPGRRGVYSNDPVESPDA